MVYLPVLRIRIVVGEQTTQKIHASKFNLKETVGFYFLFFQDLLSFIILRQEGEGSWVTL